MIEKVLSRVHVSSTQFRYIFYRCKGTQKEGSESNFGTRIFFLRFGGILHGRISLNAEVARQEAAANQQVRPSSCSFHFDFAR